MSSSSIKRMLFPSAATVVEGVDDLLMLILIRLPPKSIFRFLCISKKWNYIILTPFFFKAYYTLRNKLGPNIVGLIYEKYEKATVGGGRRHEFPRRIKLKVQCTPPFHKDYAKKKRKKVCFINSSNGLTLFRLIISDTKLHILNHVTMRKVCLDGPDLGESAFALVCDHNMHDLVLNYKVVSCSGKTEKDSYLTVQSFCSRTGEWTTSTPTVMGRLDDTLHTYTSSPLVVKDTIYWFTNKHWYLVVYYVVSNMIQIVDLPSECHATCTLKLASESCKSRGDDLWLCMFDVTSCCIKIWMMSGEEYDRKKLRSCAIPSNSWILMHTLSQVPSEEDTTNRNRAYSQWWRGGVKCWSWMPSVVRLLMVKYRKQFGRYDFNRFEFSPIVEALTLSSYTL